MPGKKCFLAVMDVLDERECLVPDMDEHLIGGVMFLVGPPAIVLPFIDGGVRESFCLCPLLLKGVHLFETVHKDEVGHLLDGLERVTHASAPELIPKGVDPGFEFGGEAHGFFLIVVGREMD